MDLTALPVQTHTCTKSDVRCLYHPCTLGTWDEVTSHRLHSCAAEALLTCVSGCIIVSKDLSKAGLGDPEDRSAAILGTDRDPVSI